MCQVGGHLVRAGGAVLAALSIVAGGVVAGTGAATGAVMGIGSTDQGPWWADEILQNLIRPCEPSLPWEYGDRGCYDNGFRDEGMLGNYRGVYYGPQEVAPGATVTFTAVVVAQEAAFDVTASGESVDITSVTQHLPKGFEFVGVKVTGYTPTETPGQTVNLESTVAVDPDGGDVTVTAPAGGWALNPGSNGGKFEGGSVSLDFTYKAPEGFVADSTGFTFTGTHVPASDGWVAEATTRVVPSSGVTGSSGS